MNKSGGISVGIPSGGFGVSAPDTSVNIPDVEASKVKGDAGIGADIGGGIGFSAPEGSIEVPDMKGDTRIGGKIEVPSMEVPDMEVPTLNAVRHLFLIKK